MYKNITGYFNGLCLLMVSIFYPAISVQAGDLLLIDKLTREKKYVEAYQQATQLLDELSGQANFDFLYAISAIESGHPHHAIFALERLISQFPDNNRIKVELARAHFMAGDYKTSEEIFTQVLNSSPPENVRKNIMAFLLLIEEKNNMLRNTFYASVSVNSGWDSNYNSAPDLNTVQIGGISFTLNENSRQQNTSYAGAEASLNYQQAVHKKLLINYGAYYQQRQNINNELDTQTMGISFSPLFSTTIGHFRLPVQYQNLDLDGDSYRQYGSVGVEWMPTAKGSSQWTNFLQYGQIRYPDQSARDMNLAVIGTSYQAISKHGNLYQTAIYYNDETSDTGSGKFNEVDSLGLRGVVKWPISTVHSLYNKISLQKMKYGEIHPVFSILREDQSYSLALGWEMKLNQVTTFKAEAEYLQNSSNIDIYDYDRTSAFISLRYTFL